MLRALQLLKALFPIDVKPDGSFNAESELQPINALSPMVLTLLGIVTEVSEVHP